MPIPTPPEEAPIPLGILADSGESLSTLDAAALDSLTSQKNAETAVPMGAVKAKAKKHLGTDDDVSNPNELNQAGWAVLFGPSVPQKFKKALAPLLEFRKKQVNDSSSPPERNLYQEFDGPGGYQPGDTAELWLNRKSVPMGDVDPRRGVPYYVMIVASPEDISFEFQYGLDLFWAVGRVWFDKVEDFKAYAESVIEYETMSEVRTSRQMAIFAPRNGSDKAMGLLTENLALPMTRRSETKGPFGESQKFHLQTFVGEAATKNQLNRIFAGRIENGPPALAFTGSHGMVFLPEDVRQEVHQGAIICQEWEGGPPKRDQYYSGVDAANVAAKIHGMIHIMFCCYGGGWPKLDTFSRLQQTRPDVAPKPMLAQLPGTLLSHPRGGALAVLAHIDRAWSSSYRSPKLGPQIEGFRTVVERLMSGMRIGHATDRLNQRWSVLSTELAEVMSQKLEGIPVDEDNLRSRWIARDDARNYVVLGDPAVRLRKDDMKPIEP